MTKAKAHAHSTSSSALLEEARQSGQKVAGLLDMKVVMHHQVPIMADHQHGHTIGQMIDNHLVDAAKEGADVEEITFSLEEDFWNGLKESILSDA